VGGALQAGVKDEEALLEGSEAIRGEGDGSGGDVAAAAKMEEGEAAASAGELVLQPDTLLDEFAFDVDGFSGELASADDFAVEGVQSMEQADSEARGGTQAGAGGEVGDNGDFDAAVDVHKA